MGAGPVANGLAASGGDRTWRAENRGPDVAAMLGVVLLVVCLALWPAVARGQASPDPADASAAPAPQVATAAPAPEAAGPRPRPIRRHRPPDRRRACRRALRTCRVRRHLRRHPHRRPRLRPHRGRGVLPRSPTRRRRSRAAPSGPRRACAARRVRLRTSARSRVVAPGGTTSSSRRHPPGGTTSSSRRHPAGRRWSSPSCARSASCPSRGRGRSRPASRRAKSASPGCRFCFWRLRGVCCS